MKGITAFMIEIFLLVLTVSLFLIFLDPIRRIFASGKPSTSTPPMFSSSTTTFDYSTYLLDPNPVDIDQYDNYNTDLCKKLKNALKYVVMTGRPYKVDEIAYGSDLISSVPFPFIGNCVNEILETEIANGLNQTVCDFNTITTNQYDPASLASPYGGVSDSTKLSFDNCFYRKISYNSLFYSYTGPDENLNHAPDVVNLFYSPDYLYIRNGDYSHYDDSIDPPIVNVNAFNNAYNGPGRLKIYVGDAQSKNGDCTFNIYFCPRPAIAKSVENSTISIFNLFKDFELASLKFEFRPYYITDLSDSASVMRTIILLPPIMLPFTTDFSKKVYYWNYYDVDLDGDYDVSTILNAIKEGFYLNIKGKNYFFAQPHWDIARDVAIDKNRECWSSDYDDIINSGSVNDRTHSIRFNCGDDNVCKRQLRIRIAIRLDNLTRNIDSYDTFEELNYMSGFISFCDEGTIGTYCGDNMRDGSEQCDCGTTPDCSDEGGGDLGGYNCNNIPEHYIGGTLKCTNQCKFDTSSCTAPVCGNNIREGSEQCDCGTTPDCSDEGGGDLGGGSCGPVSCPDKCESYKEYRGGAGSGTLKCKPLGLNECKFDTSDCSACSYSSVKDCIYGCKDSSSCLTGVLGSCTEVWNVDSTEETHCANAWGSETCAGGACTCNSGTRTNTFEAYVWNYLRSAPGWCLFCGWPWPIANGYGQNYECLGAYGSLRPQGGWMELWDAGSSTKDYSQDTWGEVSCSGKDCTCSKGSVSTTFESYAWNSVRNDKGYGYQKVCLVSNPADGKKPIGGCTEFWDPQTSKWDLCKLPWGDGYCSGTSCLCSSGSKTAVMDGVFVWDGADRDWTYSYKRYCVL